MAAWKLRFFGPKPAGLEQFSNKNKAPAFPKTRRKTEADQCGALADRKNEVAFQVGFEIQIFGTLVDQVKNKSNSIDQLFKGYEEGGPSFVDQLSSI